jgi:hypothetical protein
MNPDDLPGERPGERRADKKHKSGNTMLQNALKLCAKMSAASVEFRLITRLPTLVAEYEHPHRALRELEQVRALLDVDPELIDHAYMQLPHVIPAAIDEAAKTFVEGLDRDGWTQVLLAALEVPDYPSENVIDMSKWVLRLQRQPG